MRSSHQLVPWAAALSRRCRARRPGRCSPQSSRQRTTRWPCWRGRRAASSQTVDVCHLKRYLCISGFSARGAVRARLHHKSKEDGNAPPLSGRIGVHPHHGSSGTIGSRGLAVCGCCKKRASEGCVPLAAPQSRCSVSFSLSLRLSLSPHATKLANFNATATPGPDTGSRHKRNCKAKQRANETNAPDNM